MKKNHHTNAKHKMPHTCGVLEVHYPVISFGASPSVQMLASYYLHMYRGPTALLGFRTTSYVSLRGKLVETQYLCVCPMLSKAAYDK